MTETMIAITSLANFTFVLYTSFRAWPVCPRRLDDERTLCPPRILPGLLTADEATVIVNATETAAAAIGYTTSRHKNYPTTDLPTATVFVHGGKFKDDARGAVDKARQAVARSLADRCGAVRAHLFDGFIIKYAVDGQSGLAQHGDAGRYSATVALSPPRRAGVRVPQYATVPVPTKCRRRARDPAATCVERPDMLFGQERYGREYPLFRYSKMCPETCFGETCDAVAARGINVSGCDCTTCAGVESLGPRRDGGAYVDGGGTRFSSLRDATFFPDVGEAVVHGARLRHGGGDVTGVAPRYVLAFFFDEELCYGADYDLLYTTLICTFIIAPLLMWMIFTDFSESKGRKNAAAPNAQTRWAYFHFSDDFRTRAGESLETCLNKYGVGGWRSGEQICALLFLDGRATAANAWTLGLKGLDHKQLPTRPHASPGVVSSVLPDSRLGRRIANQLADTVFEDVA